MHMNDEVLKTIIFSDFMQKLALVYASCYYLCYIIHQRQWLKRHVPHIPTQSTIEKQLVRDEIMHRLKSSEKCYDVIRMGPQTFQGLCDFCEEMVIFKTHNVSWLKSKLPSFFTLYRIMWRPIHCPSFFVVPVRPLVAIFITC